jgi:hypothetical protein
MHRRIIGWALVCLCAGQTGRAQELKLWNRTVQVHGFASQGFAYTDQNNWLTMNTTSGSGAFTDFGLNASTAITDKLRVGAQVYDRDIAQIGKWYPELDWAFADYRVRNWFGVRGGKVKSTMGLYNDTQDLDFLHPWAILPQSIYPLDLRAGTMSHVGGDLYGDIPLGKKFGTLSYTAYAGRRPEDPHGGFVLGLASVGLTMHSYAGWVQGEDLRWNTPLKGLLVGASLASHHITGNGMLTGSGEGITFLSGLLQLPTGSIEREHSRKDDYYQYYVQYRRGALLLEGEYRREFRDEWVGYWKPGESTLAVTFDAISDSRAWYGAASYRITKRWEVGTYYSWFIANWPAAHALPTNHVYDKDLTARFDINSHWNVKLEGHFMNGYGAFDSIRGFYAQQNPNGLKADTNALVLRTSFSF